MSSRRRRVPLVYPNPEGEAGTNMVNLQQFQDPSNNVVQDFPQAMPQNYASQPTLNQYAPYQTQPYPPDQQHPVENGYASYNDYANDQITSPSFIPHTTTYPASNQAPHPDLARQPENTHYATPNALSPDAYGQTYQVESPPLTCPLEFVRLTLGAFPQSNELLNNSHLPLGLIIQPLSEAFPVDVIDASGSQIVRCRHCRAYINPFVKFLEKGRRWQCCICDYYNNLPDDYFSQDGQQFSDDGTTESERTKRLELNSCVVEYLTPASYTSRPPIPPTYLFLINVSYYSVSTGLLQLISDTLVQLIDKLPGESRTKICIIAFDSQIRYFDFSGKTASMLVHTNAQDFFIPPGHRFLIDCHENSQAISNLLQLLPKMFQDTKDVQSCLGTALSVARMIMKPIGGKLLVFTGLIPISLSRNDLLGPGRLVNRFNSKNLGKTQESALVQPQADGKWYREFAVDCTRDQISIHLFLFDQQGYLDVATLSQLSTHTSGQLYYYPEWKTPMSAENFCKDLENNLLRATAWEAVMRVRCSHGIRILSYLGNLFVKSTDLIVLCTLDPEKAYGLRFSLSKNLNNVPQVFVQSALLYSSSAGERRVRVITTAIPTASTLTDVFQYADCEAIVALLGKLAIDKLVTTDLAATSESLTSLCVKVMVACRSAPMNNKSRDLPDSLAALPLLILALLKTHALRTTPVHPDFRSSSLCLLQCISTSSFIHYLYPTLYQIHPLGPDWGTLDPNSAEQEVILPPTLNLTCSNIDKRNIYALCDGQEILVWFGSEVAEDSIEHLFGFSNLSQIIAKNIPLRSGKPGSVVNRFWNILDELRKKRPYFQKVTFIADATLMSNKFFDYLLEDRVRGLPSYHEFAKNLGDRINKLESK